MMKVEVTDEAVRVASGFSTTGRESDARYQESWRERLVAIAPHMSVADGLTKPLVKLILQNAGAFEWSLQGLGMLRTYIEPELRLHIWSMEHEAEGASNMHTHPWDFESFVVAGEVTNTRFEVVGESDLIPPNVEEFMAQRIFCGVGGGLVDGPQRIRLRRLDPEIYGEGATYKQLAAEIHVSAPQTGTVTIIRRHFHEDVDHAHVFWPVGEEWGSAEPRPATPQEVEEITSRALELWF